MNWNSLAKFKLFHTSWFPLLQALVGGVLMGLTTAPVSAWFFAWIALAPLWILIVNYKQEVKGKKDKKFSFYFLLFPLLWGIGYHGLAIFWITGIHPMSWMGVPWLASLAIALFAWTFLTLWGATLVIIWSICLFWINDRISPHPPHSSLLSPLIRVIIATALWCGLESFWSLGPLWWTSISYTQSPHNLAILHLGQLSGPNTVTAAIVAINGLIAEAWINSKNNRKFNKKYLGVAAGLLFGLHLIGFGLYNQPLIKTPDTALKVGIIQGNIPNEIKLYRQGWEQAIAGYTTGYIRLADLGVDAILTPETALPFQLDELRRGSFYAAVLEKGVIAWLGAFGEQGRSYTNSLYTITARGDIFSRYDKIKLVPLGEYIPFEQALGKIIDRLSPLDAHLAAGSAEQLFDTPFGRAIIGICYDSAFSEHFRRQASAGGEFILTASNNAHYSKEMPAQHHAQDVMRAIETNRWAVRATNTGYSGIVDPHGRTIWISQINTYQIHADTIYRLKTKTLYVRWGDWLTPILLIISAIALFLKPLIGRLIANKS